ncbi:MAG: cell division protein FtsW, partial [Novosphingobium sp.]|nr:cell division protein FtsW [Novosphingobium sp.]
MASSPPFVPHAGKAPQAGAARLRRSRRAELAVWWREIDRVLLFLVLALMGIGTAAVAASSPASARRLSTAAVRL